MLKKGSASVSNEVPLAFSKDQIIPANQLKSYPLRKLRQDLTEKGRIAIHFGGKLEGIMLSYEQYERLAKYIEELEDELEETQLLKIMAARNPDEASEWLEYRPGILEEDANER